MILKYQTLVCIRITWGSLLKMQVGCVAQKNGAAGEWASALGQVCMLVFILG